MLKRLKQYIFLQFWTNHRVTVMKVDIWSMTSCQWAAFLWALHQWGHWSPNKVLRVHNRPAFLQPTGVPPLCPPSAPNMGHAWLVSLLVVLNQEMWGIKMQQVSSCVPTGSFFVSQMKPSGKSLLRPTHTRAHPHIYLVKYLQNTITYSVSKSSMFCWCCCTLQDNNSAFSDLQSAAFSAPSLLDQIIARFECFFLFFLHLKAGW